MSTYPITSISLAPVPGIHNGTGTFGITAPFVVPASVLPPRQLQFTSQAADVTTMLFAIAENVVPNWFGVAVPSGISEFGNVNIFFHPTPAQAGYLDADYVSKSGQWPDLFYYMERLGFQLDAAARNQVIIMPFLTETAKDAGIFPGNWQEIVSDILSGVQTAITGTSGSLVNIQAIAVSSFSAGIVYSDSFRARASGLSAVLTEVWDLDGNFSTYRSISQNLRATAGCRVIQYDQITSNDSLSFHVPLPRWSNCTPAPTTPGACIPTSEISCSCTVPPSATSETP